MGCIEYLNSYYNILLQKVYNYMTSTSNNYIGTRNNAVCAKFSLHIVYFFQTKLLWRKENIPGNLTSF